jgi:hypothetical protein
MPTCAPRATSAGPRMPAASESGPQGADTLRQFERDTALGWLNRSA